jgi:MFS family permease
LTRDSSGRPTETTGFVYFATLVIALGGLLFGYNATVIAGAILFIEKQFPMSPLMEESVIAASLMGALVGAAVGGPLADRFGRRWVLLLAAAAFLFGALGSGLSPNVPALAAGRGLVGCGIGIVSVVGTLYLAEISPDRVRGRLVSIYMAANMGGVILGYLVELALDAEGSWRWMLGFPVIIAVPFALGVWALPETPRWCVCNGRLEPARAALKRLRRGADVDRELAHIQASVGGGKGRWSDLLAAAVRPALVLGIGLGILQRITGIDIPFFYGPTIFEFAGMQSVSMDILAGLGVGTALLSGQLLALVLVDHLGRRPLLLLGYGGMVCGLFPPGIGLRAGRRLAARSMDGRGRRHAGGGGLGHRPRQRHLPVDLRALSPTGARARHERRHGRHLVVVPGHDLHLSHHPELARRKRDLLGLRAFVPGRHGPRLSAGAGDQRQGPGRDFQKSDRLRSQPPRDRSRAPSILADTAVSPAAAANSRFRPPKCRRTGRPRPVGPIG